MAFFKFRLPGQSAAPRGGREAAAAVQAESVDALRRRARHRLIGATVLVLAAVIGFPLLFDTQPRPVSVDVPISIPDRQKTKPLTLPATPPAASGAVSPAAGLDPNEEVVAAPQAAAPRPAEAKPAAPKAELPAPPQTETKTQTKLEPKPEAQPRPAAQADEGAKARALLDGRLAEDGESDRMVVQVGAFADAAKAREARAKLEKAGIKTYTQVVETKDGKRVRVRVGPFASKAEADKAASKIRKLDLPAAILTL